MANIIDKIHGAWREVMVRKLSLPCDVECIRQIPLREDWPNDESIWHDSKRGFYHQLCICLIETVNHPSGSDVCCKIWKKF